MLTQRVIIDIEKFRHEFKNSECCHTPRPPSANAVSLQKVSRPLFSDAHRMDLLNIGRKLSLHLRADDLSARLLRLGLLISGKTF